MRYDDSRFPFSSRRQLVYARRGMVACTHPVAAEAGLRMLNAGGNAIDAAVAMAATLTVVEPGSNGIGGDNFAIVHSGGKLYGLNSSGYAPAALTYEACERAGGGGMPTHGWEAVTVPGAPAGWQALNERFGRLPFARLFEPAVEAAEEGFALSAPVVAGWQGAGQTYTRKLGLLARGWHDVYSREGKPYTPGEVFRCPGHARTLRAIAETRARAFYEGEVADALLGFSRATGGYFDERDLAEYRPEWVNPIGVAYRGHTVWELPPNGQGIVALMALNILKGFEFGEEDFGTRRTLHLTMEAIKLAFADALAYVGDARGMRYTPEQLLSEDYAAQRRAMIGERALPPREGTPPSGGTVYFAAADGEGNMISMIQSNYMGFGSGLVVPGYGVSLQNRGACFTLARGHDNAPAPRKKPYHTIIPGFLTRGDEAIGPFGVMGGYMQPQGHVQVIMNALDFHMNPQAALDAPRFCWQKGCEVAVESGHTHATLAQLQRDGHQFTLCSPEMGNAFGRGQIIWRTRHGTLCGGTEPRGEGTIYAV